MQGPFSGSEILNYAASGDITAQTMLRSAQGTKNEWVNAKRLPKIAAIIKENLQETAQVAQIASISRNAELGYSTGDGTTMMIGGILSILTGLVHIFVFWIFLIPIFTGILLFIFGVIELMSSAMAGKVPMEQFRSRAQLIGILEIASGIIGNCLMPIVGLMTLISLPKNN